MILVCPLCHTRYLITASVFASGPRRVRCARCKHSWEAAPPKEIEVVSPPLPEPDPPPETVTPIPPGSSLPVVVKSSRTTKDQIRLALQAGIPIAILLLTLLGVTVARYRIAATWPSMENLYEKVGLHIYHFGEGLSFQGVRSEVRYDSGLTQLIVEGKIHNETTNKQEIPNILATAIGSDGNTIQSWQIDAPATTVAPSDAVPFHSAITAPKDTVTEINLSFIEKPHDSE